MQKALLASGRDVVYSLSNNTPYENIPMLAPLANSWRTTGDIRDTWASMSRIGFSQDKWVPFATPGHWNDPDMLVVGYVGWGNPRPSGLTPHEQYTHMSLSAEGLVRVYTKSMADGSKAIGLFNLSDIDTSMTIRWASLRLHAPQKVRDLWRMTDVGVFEHEFKAVVAPHGAELYRIWPEKTH
jgi:alpha-galactosidase